MKNTVIRHSTWNCFQYSGQLQKHIVPFNFVCYKMQNNSTTTSNAQYTTWAEGFMLKGASWSRHSSFVLHTCQNGGFPYLACTLPYFQYGSVRSFVTADGSESGIIQLWSSFFFLLHVCHPMALLFSPSRKMACCWLAYGGWSNNQEWCKTISNKLVYHEYNFLDAKTTCLTWLLTASIKWPQAIASAQ